MNRVLRRLRFRIDHGWTPPHASEYLDGELSAGARKRLERHVDDCPECRELLRGLKLLIANLGTLRAGDGELVAASLATSVRALLDQAPPQSR